MILILLSFLFWDKFEFDIIKIDMAEPILFWEHKLPECFGDWTQQNRQSAKDLCQFSISIHTIR